MLLLYSACTIGPFSCSFISLALNLQKLYAPVGLIAITLWLWGATSCTCRLVCRTSEGTEDLYRPCAIAENIQEVGLLDLSTSHFYDCLECNVWARIQRCIFCSAEWGTASFTSDVFGMLLDITPFDVKTRSYKYCVQASLESMLEAICWRIGADTKECNANDKRTRKTYIWRKIPLYPSRRDLEQVLHSQLPVALWRETPTCIRCVSGAPLSSRPSGLEEALLKIAWVNKWMKDWWDVD